MDASQTPIETYNELKVLFDRFERAVGRLEDISGNFKLELMLEIIKAVFGRAGGTWTEVVGAYRDCCEVMGWPHGGEA